jgi:hypothetical protein
MLGGPLLEIAARRDEQAASSLQSLRDSAERQDDCAAECELAVLAQLRVEDPGKRLALAHEGFWARITARKNALTKER